MAWLGAEMRLMAGARMEEDSQRDEGGSLWNVGHIQWKGPGLAVVESRLSGSMPLVSQEKIYVEQL